MKKNVLSIDTSAAPFFSVVVTVYNRAKLVTRALKSLISQTESDWEGIIVDDGSTDDTYSHILPYLKTYSNISYIKQSNKGEASAKNKGIMAARGKFITFLDSDDEFSPLHLELRKVILIQNPSAKFLYGGAKILGNQYVPDRYNYSKKVNLNDCIIGGTFFIDRKIVISLKGFSDILIGTDADFYERAEKAGITPMKISHSTYVYHHETEDSITNKLIVKS